MMSSTPPSMSMTVWRTRPVVRLAAAPMVRLTRPLVIAASRSASSGGSPWVEARARPSTETASA
jgi:hypothetical protein